MPQNNPKPGELYLHFKQKMYQIVTVAQHSETGEKLVIYQALYGEFKTYARPFSMFISSVDTEKYPNVEQKYRFQFVERTEEPIKESVDIKPAAETKAEQNAEPETAKRQETKTEPDTPEAKMMAFFDADTIEAKYKILLTMSDCITDHMINNMAVVLDLVIEDGPVEKRFEELKHCLRTMQQYESTRLR